MSEFINLFGTSNWMFIDAIVTILTVAGVGYNFYQNIVQSKKIELCFLLDTGKEICIKTHLLRKHFTRAEITGVLGFFRKDMDKSHKVSYLSSEQFLKDIYDIQNNKKDKLSIKVTEDELKQFEV